MLSDRIDLHRLRRDIVSCAAEARSTKTALRRTWTEPMADEQRRLARLAHRMTELWILIAHRRGRVHVSTPPRDVRQSGAAWDRQQYHAQIAERVARDYLIPTEAPAATVSP